jgi:hypothetical protein
MSTANNGQTSSGRDLAPLTPAPVQPATPQAGRQDDGPPGPRIDLAAAAIESRARKRSGTGLRRRLARVLGRGGFSQRAALSLLAAESAHIGPSRDPGQDTHGEALIQAIGKSGADAAVTRSLRRIVKHVEDVERLQEQHAKLLSQAAQLSAERVRHPDGGLRSVDEVAQDEDRQRAHIEDDRANGSRKHQRLPRWLGRIPQLVLVIDFCLLLYFFSGITDVDWASPLSADLVFAVLLAVMVTVLAYGFLSFVGHRLRSHKDHSGAIAFADLDGVTRASAVAAVIAIAVLSVLMFTRMRIEVLFALGPDSWATALLNAVTLAVVSALANFLVITVHALDGSDEVARLEALSRAVDGPLGQARKLSQQADGISSQIARRRRRADRIAAQAATEAEGHQIAANKVIDASHAFSQATGPHAGPASAPAPDLRPLRTALGHINAELTDATESELS